MGKQIAWDVWLVKTTDWGSSEQQVDTVFYEASMEGRDVRKSLIEHDGYDPGIKLTREIDGRRLTVGPGLDEEHDGSILVLTNGTREIEIWAEDARQYNIKLFDERRQLTMENLQSTEDYWWEVDDTEDAWWNRPAEEIIEHCERDANE